MPQGNRDKESLYTPGKLSKVFLVSSVALLAALAWMLLADHYARPWKSVQRGYYEAQSKVLEDIRKRAEGLSGKLLTRAIKKGVGKSVTELERKAVAAQSDRWEASYRMLARAGALNSGIQSLLDEAAQAKG